ncbi:MAG: hypothetical protein AAGA50_00980 [Pseudomonadota bacterium]
MADRRKWTFENVREIAKRFRSRRQFRQEAYKAYSAAHRNGWLNRVCEHMKRERQDWTLEECRQIARRYTRRSEFMLDANGTYQSAYRKGWLDEICSHM